MDPQEDLYGPPDQADQARRRWLASQSGDLGNGLSSRDQGVRQGPDKVASGSTGDPLGPPSAHATKADAWAEEGGASGSTGSQSKNGASSDSWKPNTYKAAYAPVPSANFGAKMADGTNTLHSFLGNLFGNQKDIAAATAHNDLEHRKYQDSLEAAKVEAPLHYYKNQFGGSGNQRTTYVRGDDGKLHVQRYNPRSDAWEVSPEEAVIPQVETQHARNEAPGKAKTTDQFFADVQAHPGDYDEETQKLATEYLKRKGSFAPQRAFALQPFNTDGGVVSFNPNKGTVQPVQGVQGTATKVAAPINGGRPRQDPQFNKLIADAISNGAAPEDVAKLASQYKSVHGRASGQMPDQRAPQSAPAPGSQAAPAQPPPAKTNYPPNRKLRLKDGSVVTTDGQGQIVR